MPRSYDTSVRSEGSEDVTDMVSLREKLMSCRIVDWDMLSQVKSSGEGGGKVRSRESVRAEEKRHDLPVLDRRLEVELVWPVEGTLILRTKDISMERSCKPFRAIRSSSGGGMRILTGIGSER